jgi:AcrR family transcriptional regulator
MANLRQLQKEMTRQRLLTKALELFQERGYVGTTIDDIAAAAGTTRVTFYAHFESRQDLMRALIHELNVHLEREDAPGRRSTASALVEAVHVGTAASIGPWLRAQAARWPEIKPYIIAATEAAAIDGDIRALLEGWFDEVISDIEDGLARAGRFEPATQHFRGRLAMAQLDFTALHGMREEWDLETDPALDVLTESWVKLLGTD